MGSANAAAMTSALLCRHMAPYATGQGLTQEESALMLAVMGGASVCGRLVLGFAADYIGRIWVLKFSMLTLLSASITWTYATTAGCVRVSAPSAPAPARAPAWPLNCAGVRWV